MLKEWSTPEANVSWFLWDLRDPVFNTGGIVLLCKASPSICIKLLLTKVLKNTYLSREKVPFEKT